MATVGDGPGRRHTPVPLAPLRHRYEALSFQFFECPPDGGFAHPEQAGTLMVFKGYGDIGYALVMEATQAIHIHDAVRNPI